MRHFSLRRLYGVKFTYALVFVIASSWMLFPFVVSWVFPWLTRGVVFASWLAVAAWFIFSKIKVTINYNFVDKFGKFFLICIGVYFLALLASSYLNYHSYSEWYFYVSAISKYVFFLFLLYTLTTGAVEKSLELYSNICVILVCLSLINVTGLYFGWWYNLKEFLVLQGVTTPRVMWVSWSGFDGYARIFQEISNAFRIQSFSMEPGDFSLALLPAIYRELLLKKGSVLKFIILSVGVAATWSFGAVLMLMICAAFYLLFSIDGLDVYAKKAIYLIFTCVLFFGSHSILSDSIKESHYSRGLTAGETTETTETTEDLLGGNKGGSFMQRVIDIQAMTSYLGDNPLGSGAGIGRKAADSNLSVGYANAAVESGIIGGVFYSLGYIILSLGVMISLWTARKRSDDLTELLMVLGMSVLTCLFFGLQREQPDSNLWFMWILASYFYISYRARKV